MAKNYKQTGFYTLPGVDLAYSGTNEVYEHIVEDDVDLEEIGVTDMEIIESFESGDGQGLYKWIEEHEKPLFIEGEWQCMTKITLETGLFLCYNK